jgi:hypothetical protein
MTSLKLTPLNIVETPSVLSERMYVIELQGEISEDVKLKNSATGNN